MLKLIGFDGDDTLWHSEGYYREASASFTDIVGRYVDVGDAQVQAGMLATERRNLKLFGYGAKGMTNVGMCRSRRTSKNLRIGMPR